MNFKEKVTQSKVDIDSTEKIKSRKPNRLLFSIKSNILNAEYLQVIDGNYLYFSLSN